MRLNPGEAEEADHHGRPVARLVPYGSQPVGLDRAAAAHVREPGGAYESRSIETFRSPEARRTALRRLLEEDIRSRVPAELRRKGISKREREQILGYAEDDA